MPNLSGTPDGIDAMFHKMMSSHEDLISKMRDLVYNRNAIDSKAFLDEYDTSFTSTVTVTPQIDRPAVIQTIIYSYTPATAPGFLTIGRTSGKFRNIPIVTGNTILPGIIVCKMVLNPGDVCTLTSANSTQTYLEIMGQVLSGTEWSTI